MNLFCLTLFTLCAKQVNLLRVLGFWIHQIHFQFYVFWILKMVLGNVQLTVHSKFRFQCGTQYFHVAKREPKCTRLFV